jgi:amino acid transporter
MTTTSKYPGVTSPGPAVEHTTAVRGPKREALLSETYIPQVMPPILGSLDMTAAYIMAVFWVSNITGVATGGAAGFTFWLLCGLLFFVPCAIVVAQLGVLYPNEGSLYNWTHHTLGAFWSFFVSLCGWLPGILSLVSAAFVIVNLLQAINSTWLPQAWQQGVVIIVVIAVAGLLSIQRFRLVQNLINYAAFATLVVVLLIGLAAVVWLLRGKTAATNFGDLSGWAISVDPQTTNLYLLGTVTLALLGANMPLNFAGEVSGRRPITRHLLWGSVLVMGGYLLLTFAVLVVEGQNAALATPNPVFLLIDTVDKGLGKIAADVTFIGIMLFFLMVGVFENCTSARLMMVAAVDRRLPLSLAKLNKHRVPANALIFQTIIAAAYSALIFFVAPFITVLGDPTLLTIKAYEVTAAALVLAWAFSFVFPFINLAILYVRDRAFVLRKKIVPIPVMWASIVLGPFVCLAAIVDSLAYSWIPSLIPNALWLPLVGGLILACLFIISAISMYASSQASWEDMEGNV